MKPSATSAKNSSKTKLHPPLEIIRQLKLQYPDAHCALIYETPFQLLIATILSAQCTDERVNKVTEVLFAKYPDAKKLADADIDDIEEIVKSTGFYRAKAKNIFVTAKVLMEKYDGEVPQKVEALIELPGVGRKTANVVLGNAYGISSGVVVDTHVRRISQRLGWTLNIDPEKIAGELEQMVPITDWILLPHLLIFHGRQICKARNPACAKCFLSTVCPKKNVPLSKGSK